MKWIEYTIDFPQYNNCYTNRSFISKIFTISEKDKSITHFFCGLHVGYSWWRIYKEQYSIWVKEQIINEIIDACKRKIKAHKNVNYWNILIFGQWKQGKLWNVKRFSLNPPLFWDNTIFRVCFDIINFDITASIYGINYKTISHDSRRNFFLQSRENIGCF